MLRMIDIQIIIFMGLYKKVFNVDGCIFNSNLFEIRLNLKK